jgi:hypothetical protein
MSRRRAFPSRLVVPLVALLMLPACLVVVSTGPTSLGGATIVFVAVTDHGGLVAALHVSVTDTDSDWRDDGVTASDGTFHCEVGPGVRRVRAQPTPPAGYVMAGEHSWPRDIEVPDEGTLEVQVRVRAAGG